MNVPVKIGVVGVGQFGRLHAATLAELDEFELVAICDRDSEAAREVASAHGVPAFVELEPMLREVRADAVVIATRSDSHVTLAERALARGLHAFVEKPLASSTGEIERLARAARSANRKVMVNHICVFHSTFGILRREVVTRGFRSIRFVRHRPQYLVKRFPEDNPVSLTMMHDLYLAGLLAEGREPVRIEGWQARNAEGMVDMTWARLEWAAGNSVTLESHWTLPKGVAYDGWDYTEVFGNGFHLKVNTNPGPMQMVTDRYIWPIALEIARVEGRPVGMLAESLRSFAECCRGQAVPGGCRLQDALQVQRWMDGIFSAIQKKEPSRQNEKLPANAVAVV